MVFSRKQPHRINQAYAHTTKHRGNCTILLILLLIITSAQTSISSTCVPSNTTILHTQQDMYTLLSASPTTHKHNYQTPCVLLWQIYLRKNTAVAIKPKIPPRSLRFSRSKWEINIASKPACSMDHLLCDDSWNSVIDTCP